MSWRQRTVRKADLKRSAPQAQQVHDLNLPEAGSCSDPALSTSYPTRRTRQTMFLSRKSVRRPSFRSERFRRSEKAESARAAERCRGVVLYAQSLPVIESRERG